MHKAWLLIGLCLMGCASGPEVVKAPPLAEDLVGWSPVTPVVETPDTTEGPSLPEEPAEARSAQERVYVFVPGRSQRIDVGIGVPLDLIFQAGEEIHNIVGGDRAPADAQDQTLRWEVQQGYSGAGKQGRPHVFLAVTKPGLTTSLVITTTKRTYYLDCRSVAKTSVRSVRWTYDDEPRVAQPPKPRLIPDPSLPQRYHVGYTIATTEPTPVWSPRQALDNGRQTFVIFPPTVTTVDAPLLRLVGPNGPELVNSRMVGSVMVLDHVVNCLELRLGTGKGSEVVTVQRETPRTIRCPGDQECPVWPHTAVAQQEVRR